MMPLGLANVGEENTILRVGGNPKTKQHLENFGFVDGSFAMVAEEEADLSILAKVGSAVSWIFIPLGWGNWQAAVASITGLVAKENIVGTMGVLYGGGELSTYQMLALKFIGVSGMSFLVFNLLCAPCFAAIGAIKREMNNAKWTLFAIGWQCGFAYVIALMIYQFGSIFTGNLNIFGLIVSVLLLGFMVYMLFIKKYHEAVKRSQRRYSMTWILANIWTIVIVLILIAIVTLIIIKLIKDKKKGKSSCGCDCGCCSMAGSCKSAQKK